MTGSVEGAPPLLGFAVCAVSDLALCVLSLALYRTYGHRFLVYWAASWLMLLTSHTVGTWASNDPDAFVAHSLHHVLCGWYLTILVGGVVLLVRRRSKPMRWLPWSLGATTIAALGLASFAITSNGTAASWTTHYPDALSLLAYGASALIVFRGAEDGHPIGKMVLCATLLSMVAGHAALLTNALPGEMVMYGLVAGQLVLGLGVAVWALEREHTSLKQTSHALEQRGSELLQMRKMEALGRMAGGVAHGFNNLLTTIQGHVDLLSDRVIDSHGSDSLGEVRKAVRKGAGLTGQLLSMSSHRTGRPESIAVDDSLNNLVGVMRRVAGSHATVMLDLAAPNRSIRLATGDLEQIVSCLVTNAGESMADIGRIIVSTRALPDSEGVEITIVDSGQGMDERTRLRAAEPFFTTKPVGSSHGLGLSTTFGLVTKSGGTIEIDSREGEGTTVRLRWPLAPGSSRSADTSVLDLLDLKGATVLLVEDDEVNRDLLQQLLQMAGFRVITASDGPEALELVGSMETNFDLILTDVVMPQMTGTELARRVARLRPDLPTLFISGYTGDGTPSAGIDKDQLLRKPFTLQSLLRFLRVAIAAAPKDSAS